MTAKELLERLAKIDPDAEVFFDKDENSRTHGVLMAVEPREWKYRYLGVVRLAFPDGK